MNVGKRRTAAVLTSVLLALGVVGLSQVPYAAVDTESARVRFAWRLRGARVEECRRLTDEELSSIPAHMRQEEVCEGRVMPYRLTVHVAGEPVLDQTVVASGAKEDSPLYVNEEMRVDPGLVPLRVRFVRQGNVEQAFGSELSPAALELSDTLRLVAGQIVVVSYDTEVRRLVILAEQEEDR